MKNYTEKEWQEEMNLSLPIMIKGYESAGSRNLSCPSCGTTGFYGPRQAEKRKYRACKFCGFWQEVSGVIKDERGGDPYRCIAIRCSKCGIDNWRLPWDKNKFGDCEKCGGEYVLGSWAIDDKNHPFHKIKEEMDKVHKEVS